MVCVPSDSVLKNSISTVFLAGSGVYFANYKLPSTLTCAPKFITSVVLNIPAVSMFTGSLNVTLTFLIVNNFY